MLLHYKTKPFNAAAAYPNGIFICITTALQILTVIHDAGEDEFYSESDAELNNPLDMEGAELALMNNPDAIFQQAEIEELIATPVEEPEDPTAEEAAGFGAAATPAMAEQEPEVVPESEDDMKRGGNANAPVDPEAETVG